MNEVFYLVPNKRFVLRSQSVQIYNKTKEWALIVLLDESTGKEIVHDIQQFIFDKYSNHEYNTQRKYAQIVISFLNYTFIKTISKERITSISELTFNHGSNYLNHISFYLDKSEVFLHERILTKLYLYLAEQKVLKYYNIYDFKTLFEQDFPGSHKIIDSPFKGVMYPSRKVKNIIHFFDTDLIIPLLTTAFFETNSIALGVYFLIFGGCRVGDVINLRTCDVTSLGGPWGQKGLSLDIRTRKLNKYRSKTSGSNEVKNERIQVIFPYKAWIPTLWEEHIKRYKAIDGSNALFVNKKGNAMTGEDFRYSFNKLRLIFLNKLKSSSDTDLQMRGLFLSSKKWSTHIGRGLFSNMLANESKTPIQLAVARGDKDLTSSLTYIATSQPTLTAIETAINKMQRGFIQCVEGKNEITDD